MNWTKQYLGFPSEMCAQEAPIALQINQLQGQVLEGWSGWQAVERCHTS